MLLARSPNKVTNCADFDDALRLFYDKESVAQYNMRKLESLGESIARINAIHSNAAAASTKADDAGGLHSVLFLAVGACVMLTANLWQEPASAMEQPELFTKFYTVMITNHLTSQLQYSFVLTHMLDQVSFQVFPVFFLFHP